MEISQWLEPSPTHVSRSCQTFDDVPVLRSAYNDAKPHPETSSSNINLKVLERSLFSAKYCFIKHAREHGNLSDAEYEVITDWVDYLTRRSQLDLQVDLVVYVWTLPEVAWNHVKSRGRSEEDTVPLKYLQEIHQLHEDWLFTPNPDFDVEVMILNGDQDLVSGTHRHQDIVRRVL